MVLGTRQDGSERDSRTRLVLIRHAESIANTSRVFGGHETCRGLTDEGRAQAAALRDRLAAAGGIPATALFTSDLRRAIETAGIVAPSIGAGRYEAQRRCDLCELHWGDMEGQPTETYRGVDTIYQPVATGGGESWLRFMLRCRRALEDVAKQCAGRTAVIVTHAGVIRASMYHFARIPDRRAVELDIEYTGITVWSTTAGDRRWRLETYNDHAHLA